MGPAKNCYQHGSTSKEVFCFPYGDDYFSLKTVSSYTPLGALRSSGAVQEVGSK